MSSLTLSSSSVSDEIASHKRHCQGDGCEADLSTPSTKPYYHRHKVCEQHAKASMVSVGNLQKRFCQQCSKFHELSEFDGKKKSCKNKLESHNARRRKPARGVSISSSPLTMVPSVASNSLQHHPWPSPSIYQASATRMPTLIHQQQQQLDGLNIQQQTGFHPPQTPYNSYVPPTHLFPSPNHHQYPQQQQLQHPPIPTCCFFPQPPPPSTHMHCGYSYHPPFTLLSSNLEGRALSHSMASSTKQPIPIPPRMLDPAAGAAANNYCYFTAATNTTPYGGQ